MKLDIVSFSYLFLRLAPFVLVSFFSLGSLFNQDFKGLIYLVGLIVSTAIAVMIGNGFGFTGINKDAPGICRMIELGENGEFSKLPLGQVVFGYTFAYLLYPIIANNYVLMNIPTIVFFPILILGDIIWNTQHGCYDISHLISSLFVGSVIGILWALIIAVTDVANFQYFNSVTGKDVCSRPTKSTFRCNVYKNGKLISKNF